MHKSMAVIALKTEKQCEDRSFKSSKYLAQQKVKYDNYLMVEMDLNVYACQYNPLI